MRTLYYAVAGGKHFGFYVHQGSLVLAESGAGFNSLTEILAWAAAHEFDRVARREPKQSQLVPRARRAREITMVVTLTTDGSCLGNPGVGGWACVLRCDSHEQVLEGADLETNNNRMELTGAIEGLRALTRRCLVRVVTDSEYLRRGAAEFLARWKSNGWRTASGGTVANRDLWEALDELAGYHDITFVRRGALGRPRPGALRQTRGRGGQTGETRAVAE